MKEIPLTKGLVAIVDDDDYPALAQYHWYASFGSNGNVYAKKAKTVRERRIDMHVFLMRPARGETVDHRNGNTLDNRRDNLRVCTQQQNCWNRRIPQMVGRTAPYKGVYKFNATRWRAKIGYNGKRYSLGMFATAEEAARAYDAKAREFFGEFARPNFPDGARR